MTRVLFLLCIVVHNIYSTYRNVFIRPHTNIKDNIVISLPKEKYTFPPNPRDVYYPFYDEDDPTTIKVTIHEECISPICMWAS